MLLSIALFSALLLSAPPGSSSGSVAIDESGSTVYVVNPESGYVSMIDTRSDRVIAEANGVLNPMRVAPGTLLVIPKAQGVVGRA